MAQKAQNTTLISREQAKEFFSAMDLNKDGKVQHTELARAMKQIYGVDENTTMGWFADIDKDNDKTLTYEEFVNDVCKEPRRETMKELFAKADKDGSGKLSVEELHKCCADAGLTDVKSLRAIFAKCDKDASGCLNLEEFTKLMNKEY